MDTVRATPSNTAFVQVQVVPAAERGSQAESVQNQQPVLIEAVSREVLSFAPAYGSAGPSAESEPRSAESAVAKPSGAGASVLPLYDGLGRGAASNDAFGNGVAGIWVKVWGIKRLRARSTTPYPLTPTLLSPYAPPNSPASTSRPSTTAAQWPRSGFHFESLQTAAVQLGLAIQHGTP
jgi:hypothetical protein